MLTPYRIERAFYRLENNLIDNNEVRAYYWPKFESARKILPDSLDSLCGQLNIYSKKYLTAGLLRRGKLLPTEHFAEYFIARNGMTPYPLGLVFEMRDWKKFKKLSGLEKWAGGVYYSNNFFVNMNYLPEMKELGLILMGEYSGTENTSIIEHECIHSLLNKNSGSLSSIGDMPYMQDYEFHHLAYILEARIMNELIAFQDDFSSIMTYWNTKSTIRSKYLNRQIEVIEKMHAEKNSLPRRLKRYMRDRINNDTKYLGLIVKNLPRHIRMPLLFGMGPTKAEMERDGLKSSLDDIILWSYLIQDPNHLEKAKTILNAKGYPVY